jgi:protein-S-isoprenylcysteine O-methyltransferase Ste14
MGDDGRDNAGVVAPPPLVYLLPLLVGLLLNRKVRAPFVPSGATRLVGLPLVTGGFSLGVWFYRTLHGAGTPVDPREPVSVLVTDGPYRYSRNPGYLSMAMVYAGVASLANSLPSILLLPVVLRVIQSGVIEREERYLERSFGEEYLAYKARVGRWI